MVVLRVLVALSAVGLLVVGAASCGSGLSEEDAKVRCDQDKTAFQSACFSDTAYEGCMACFQECGDTCVRLSTCPLTYTCDAFGGTGGGAAEE